MSYAGLGWWLKDNGFGDARWYNELGAQQSYAFHPEFPCFDGIGQPQPQGFDLRYGDGALKAKGFYDGRPHGGNIDLIQALIRLPSNPLRFDNNQSYALTTTDKADLNYIPGAWKALIQKAAENGLFADPPTPGRDAEESSDLSPIEVRTEELRMMAIDLLEGNKNATLKAVHELFEDEDLWPKLKPFVSAALKAYRKIMGG